MDFWCEWEREKMKEGKKQSGRREKDEVWPIFLSSAHVNGQINEILVYLNSK